MFAAFPLLALPVLAYNLLALTVAGGFGGSGAPERMSAQLFTIRTASHMLWPVSLADLLLTGALRSLFVVAEGYPQLKADRNFLALQNRISELEERIADRREFFNDGVNTYNTRIAQIPDVLMARVMKFQPRPMFRVSPQERQQVQVTLARGQAQGQV